MLHRNLLTPRCLISPLHQRRGAALQSQTQTRLWQTVLAANGGPTPKIPSPGGLKDILIQSSRLDLETESETSPDGESSAQGVGDKKLSRILRPLKLAKLDPKNRAILRRLHKHKKEVKLQNPPKPQIKAKPGLRVLTSAPRFSIRYHLAESRSPIRGDPTDAPKDRMNQHSVDAAEEEDVDADPADQDKAAKIGREVSNYHHADTKPIYRKHRMFEPIHRKVGSFGRVRKLRGPYFEALPSKIERLSDTERKALVETYKNMTEDPMHQIRVLRLQNGKLLTMRKYPSVKSVLQIRRSELHPGIVRRVKPSTDLKSGIIRLHPSGTSVEELGSISEEALSFERGRINAANSLFVAETVRRTNRDIQKIGWEILRGNEMQRRGSRPLARRVISSARGPRRLVSVASTTGRRFVRVLYSDGACVKGRNATSLCSVRAVLPSPTRTEKRRWGEGEHVPPPTTKIPDFVTSADLKRDGLSLHWLRSQPGPYEQAAHGGQALNDSIIRRLVRTYANIHVGREVLIQRWMAIDEQTRERSWLKLMSWALKYSPIRALLVLDATVPTPSIRPARQVAADALEEIAQFYLGNTESPDPPKVHAIWRLTIDILQEFLSEGKQYNMIYHQQLIKLVIKYSSSTQALKLLDTIERPHIRVRYTTLLLLVDRFVAMGMVQTGLDLLSRVIKRGAPTALHPIQKACAKLLRTQFNVENGYTIQSNIATQILEMGVKPRIFMYNALLLNAVEGRDYGTAWQMYTMARTNNVEPNRVTYHILLRLAKQSEDVDMMKSVTRDAEKAGVLPSDERALSALLHAVYTLSGEEQPVFNNMLNTYRRYCDLSPLKELGLIGETTEEFQTPLLTVVPNGRILRIMMLGFIRQHRHVEGLPDYYMRFYDLVQKRRPLMLEMAGNDVVFNAFVMAIGRNLQTLRYCTTIVKHMLQSPMPQDATEADKSEPGGPKIPAPTVQTWSILLAAHLGHGQKQAAERVLAMMQERNIQPNQVTWNTLVSGYSALQDVEGAVYSLKRMEAARIEVDEWTMKGMGRMMNRARLMEALRAALDVGSEKETVGTID